MKKTIAFIVSVIFMCLIVSISVYAVSAEEIGMSEDVIAILQAQIEDELELLKTKDYYSGDIPEDFTDYPIMRIYHGAIWDTADLSLQELKNHEEDHYAETEKSYLVFYKANWIFRVNVWEKEGQFVIDKSPNTLHTDGWAEDIRNMSRHMNLRGIDCEILEIAMIYSGTNGQGEMVYLATDQGTFMVYYPPVANAEGILWTQEEFRTYAKAYLAYLQEHAYGPNGEPTGGSANMVTFLEQEYSNMQLVTFDVMQARRNAAESPEPNPFPWIAVSVGVVIVAVAVTGIVVIVLRKKTNKPT